MNLRPLGRAAVIAAFVCGVAQPAFATTITFDTLPATDAIYPSNQFAAEGITIQSLILSSSIDAIGETFMAAFASDAFQVLSNTSAVSAPNFAATTNVFAQPSGALFSFSTPITSLSLQTDDAPGEFPDIVRLMALQSLGGGLFQVIAVTFGSDAETSAPGNILSLVIPGGFSYAVFATATEAEGFDNVTFTPVPEPATLGLLGAGLAAVAARARRRRSRA
jgi:hypothetical protein